MPPTVIRLFNYGACLMALGVSFSAVAGEPPTDVAHQPCPAAAVRVFLNGAGSVLLNGRQIEADRLSKELASIKPRPELICYSRDMAWAKPPATVEVVLDALIALQLPIRFYSDATFSTPSPANLDAAL